MMDFKNFMNLMAQKKCPEGYKFDKKLKVCVPISRMAYSFRYMRGPGTQTTDTSNGENGNSNGNNGNSNGNGGEGGSNGGSNGGGA